MGNTCTRKERPESSLPVAGSVPKEAGALAISAASARKGRMVACPGEKSSAENKCRDAWSSGGLPVAVPEDRNDKSGTAMRSGTCVKAETEE